MFTPASRVGDGHAMSACCSTYGNVAGAHFDEKVAKRDLESYRKKGPGTTARLLRDLLVGTGAVKGVLLDVGSGVGGLSFELLDRGAERVIAVDASPAYLAAAAQEATRRDRLPGRAVRSSVPQLQSRHRAQRPRPHQCPRASREANGRSGRVLSCDSSPTRASRSSRRNARQRRCRTSSSMRSCRFRHRQRGLRA